MINASGASAPQSPTPTVPPTTGQPQMPQAGANNPSVAPISNPSTTTAQPLAASTTPPAAGNAPVGSNGNSSGKNTLKKPKKKIPWKMIAGAIVLILTIIGATAGYFLSQTSQDVRQQASEGDLYSTTSGSGLACAGGVADGDTGCFTNNETIRCNNGSFDSSTISQCGSGQVCTGGKCQVIQGDIGTANCDESITDQNDPEYCGIFGNDGSCASDTWNIYECNSTSTSGGCQDRRIATTDSNGVGGYLAGTPSCSTRQADCVDGSSSDFRSRVNNSGNCAEPASPSPSPSEIVAPSLEPVVEVTTTQQQSSSSDSSSGGSSSGGGVGGASSPSPSPSINPELASCNEACTTDSDCGNSLHSCEANLCRLTSNPSSETCSEPTPSPSPTLSPELALCNEECTTSADCANLLHSCQSGLCRLTDNPSSETCSDEQGSEPTPVPRTEETPIDCNEYCTSNSECSSFNNICHNNRCRLSSNPENVSCTLPPTSSPTTELGQMIQQPEAPTVLPSAGADDLKNWILTGLGAIGIGAVILLLL